MQPIDLLPDLKSRRREQFVESLPRLLLTALLLWILALGGLYFLLYSERQAVQAELTGTEAQVQALEPVAQRVQQVSFLRGKVQELQDLLALNTTEKMVPAIDLLAKLMPSQIQAGQLTISGDKVSFGCRSSQLAPIGRFLQNLQQTAALADVQMSGISEYEETTGEDELQTTTVSGYSFSVSFTYKGDK